MTKFIIGSIFSLFIIISPFILYILINKDIKSSLKSSMVLVLVFAGIGTGGILYYGVYSVLNEFDPLFFIENPQKAYNGFASLYAFYMTGTLGYIITKMRQKNPSDTDKYKFG